MSSLNKCMFIGRLGSDPQVRVTSSNQKVCTFSLAVSEKYKDSNGNQQESTEWINVVLWRKQCEIAEKYLRKGSQVYLEGKWKSQSWDKDGVKHYKTELIGNHFLMLGSKGNYSENPNTSNNTPQNQNNADSVGYDSEVPPYEDNCPF